jgi:hypothetical protein
VRPAASGARRNTYSRAPNYGMFPMPPSALGPRLSSKESHGATRRGIRVGARRDGMDDTTFDQLARRLERLISRRAALGGLAGAGLLAAFGGSSLDAVGKRKKKKKKKRCKPESLAVTCAGTCGRVENNCKKAVSCPDCPTCQRCSSGGCEPDPAQDGQSCGASKVCDDGACVDCGFIGAPCCANGACVPFIGSICINDICTACGRAGEPCCGGRTCDPGLSCAGAGQGVCQN